MERPRVIIHNTASLDGQLTGFPADLGLHYEIAASFQHSAVLTGSGTVLAAAAAAGIDPTGIDPAGIDPAGIDPAGIDPTEDDPVPAEPVRTEPGSAPDDRRPWLVVVDGRGRLARLSFLRGQPYWRDVLILCCDATPPAHLERLRRHHVEHIVTGGQRVDLAAALAALADRYGVGEVGVDGGGTLNGALLRAGLVDEISVIVAPYLVGSRKEQPVHLIDGPLGAGGTEEYLIELTGVQELRDGHVWLRYSVSTG